MQKSFSNNYCEFKTIVDLSPPQRLFWIVKGLFCPSYNMFEDVNKGCLSVNKVLQSKERSGCDKVVQARK